MPNGMAGGTFWGSTTAGDHTKGYYSYNLGWHVVVLNSACEYVGGCNNGSPQQQWLDADLKSYRGVCTIAFWHVPYFGPPSNLSYQGDPGNPDPLLRHPAGTSDEEYQYGLKAIWDTLYANDVHVVVNGHLHHYERWAREDPDGNADPQNGIRQFVVGTGGAAPDDPSGRSCQPIAGTCQPPAMDGNLVKAVTQLYGVLQLTLHQDSYDWKMINAGNPNGPWEDAGTESCHSLP